MGSTNMGYQALKKTASGMLMFVLYLCPVLAQQVSLNEINASNSSVIADEDGDYEDWIEIFNYGDEKVNLKGFYLSDDYAKPYMWEFPETIILPGEYLLVWASGKDRTAPDAPLHTNFRISRDGEEVYFTNAGGKRIDEIAPTPIPTDMVYGRHPDGTGSWHYLEHPTPGSANAAHAEDPFLMHYWLFDTDIPNNTPLESLGAFFDFLPGATIEYTSCLPGYPFHEDHENWRKASMERRNMPTAINYRPEGNDDINYANANLRGLQVRSPFEKDQQQNTIVLHLPSTGFENLVVRFAARDEGAADHLLVDYSVDDSSDSWTAEGLDSAELPLQPDYQLYEIDFHEISQTDNNPDFKVRIRFGGEDMHVDDGSRVTFNNISLDGTALKAYYIHSATGGYGNIHPYGFSRVYKNRSKDFLIFPAPNFQVDKVMLDGTDVTGDVYLEDDTYTFTIGNAVADQRLQAFFSMSTDFLEWHEDGLLVYPNPVTERLTIKASEKFHKVRILSLQGSAIHESPAETSYYQVNTTALSEGMYIIVIHFDDQTVSRMIHVVGL